MGRRCCCCSQPAVPPTCSHGLSLRRMAAPCEALRPAGLCRQSWLAGARTARPVRVWQGQGAAVGARAARLQHNNMCLWCHGGAACRSQRHGAKGGAATCARHTFIYTVVFPHAHCGTQQAPPPRSTRARSASNRQSGPTNGHTTTGQKDRPPLTRTYTPSISTHCQT